MANRPFKPASYPTMIPSLTVGDPEKTIEFYSKAFGFEPGDVPPMRDEKGTVQYAEMRFKDTLIMLTPEGAFGSDKKTPKNIGQCPTGLYIYCDDVDAMYAKASSAGAEIILPPEDMFWGDRMCKVLDLDGNEFAFATNISDFDPEKMKEMMGQS